MASKTITTSQTRTVKVCDLCETELGYGNRCIVCGKEVCYRCCVSTDFVQGERRVTEFFVHVCKGCMALSAAAPGQPFHTALTELLTAADREARVVLELWRAGVKEGGGK